MMKGDFPVITRITEVRPCEPDGGGFWLDVRTAEGQRFVRLTRAAARQLFEALEESLHPPRATAGAEEREPVEFRF